MDFDVLDGLKKNVTYEIETAFRKGYSQGVEYGYNEARTLSNDRYSEGWRDGQKDAFKHMDHDECEQSKIDGMNEMYKLIQEVAIMSDKLQEECFGCTGLREIVRSYTSAVLYQKFNAWKDKHFQTVVVTKFQVGDEVKYIETEDAPIIVTRVKADYFEGISLDGETFEWLEYEDFEKTGKHFKIEVTEI